MDHHFPFSGDLRKPYMKFRSSRMGALSWSYSMKFHWYSINIPSRLWFMFPLFPINIAIHIALLRIVGHLRPASGSWCIQSSAERFDPSPPGPLSGPGRAWARGEQSDREPRKKPPVLEVTFLSLEWHTLAIGHASQNSARGGGGSFKKDSDYSEKGWKGAYRERMEKKVRRDVLHSQKLNGCEWMVDLNETELNRIFVETNEKDWIELHWHTWLENKMK